MQGTNLGESPQNGEVDRPPLCIDLTTCAYHILIVAEVFSMAWSVHADSCAHSMLHSGRHLYNYPRGV